MILVYLESPFAAATPEGLERNARFARACMLDSLARGEAPFLSHALYPQVLDDSVPEQRALGMEAGFAWAKRADKTVVYDNLGLSPGMRAGIARACAEGRPVEIRHLDGWEETTHVDLVEVEREDGSRGKWEGGRDAEVHRIAPDHEGRDAGRDRALSAKGRNMTRYKGSTGNNVQPNSVVAGALPSNSGVINVVAEGVGSYRVEGAARAEEVFQETGIDAEIDARAPKKRDPVMIRPHGALPFVIDEVRLWKIIDACRIDSGGDGTSVAFGYESLVEAVRKAINDAVDEEREACVRECLELYSRLDTPLLRRSRLARHTLGALVEVAAIISERGDPRPIAWREKACAMDRSSEEK